MAHQPRKSQNFEDTELIPAAGVLTAEAFRGAAEATRAPVVVARPEEKVSLFWRVFGGTLLSVAALVVLTVYQQFANGLNELRNNMNHVHETQADLLKKDEFNTRATSMWNAINQVGNQVKEEVPAQKTRLTSLEAQLQSLQQERKELAQQVQALTVKLAALEARQGAAPKAGKNRPVEGAEDGPID